MSPLCQTHIEQQQLNSMEPFFPLHAWVCERCFLVQLEEYVTPADIFSEYAYFSSFADSWVEHARKYSVLMRERFGIDRDSLVMEIASNDGYLLQHFVAAAVPVLGIEPAANIAKVAQDKGIRTEVCFHGRTSADKIVAKGKRDLRKAVAAGEDAQWRVVEFGHGEDEAGDLRRVAVRGVLKPVHRAS